VLHTYNSKWNIRRTIGIPALSVNQGCIEGAVKVITISLP